jgi:hypothetical protein
MLESPAMEFIRDAIEWIATETLNFGAGLFPLLMLGLVGLYILWLVVGYLRVSQVGLDEGRERRQVVALPGAGEEAAGHLETVPGAPYCPADGLQYPGGAAFCTQCERDLVVDCRGCGATLSAVEASCYRCGTPTGAAEDARLR